MLYYGVNQSLAGFNITINNIVIFGESDTAATIANAESSPLQSICQTSQSLIHFHRYLIVCRFRVFQL